MDLSWKDNYLKVLNFYSEHKRYPNINDSPEMVQWIFIQKCAFKNRLLFFDQEDLLNQIPFWHESNNINNFVNDFRWLFNFKITKNYIETYKHYPSRKTIHKSKKIGICLLSAS